jgi:ABC-type multidrug transport system fused ATPase/permease subunit
MQAIYTYILETNHVPREHRVAAILETNHVPREHRVAAILVLLFVLLISLVPALTLLYVYVSTFRSMCAVPNMAVFGSSLTSWFPGMLLTYCANDLEMVSVASIITGITLTFTFYMRCISIVRSLYFRIFSVSYLITFLSPGIATSSNIHVLFSLSRIIISGLLLGMVLPVCTC